MFVVTVLFRVKPGNEVAFLTLMRRNAAQSLADEPGCRQFDVCVQPEKPGEVFLYEVYENADAFQDHLKSAHFLSFDAAVRDRVEAKVVNSYSEVWQ